MSTLATPLGTGRYLRVFNIKKTPVPRNSRGTQTRRPREGLILHPFTGRFKPVHTSKCKYSEKRSQRYEVKYLRTASTKASAYH